MLRIRQELVGSDKQEPVLDFDEFVKEIRRLVGLFLVEDVKKALAVVEGA